MVKNYIDLEKGIFTDPITKKEYTSYIEKSPSSGRYFLFIESLPNSHPFTLLNVNSIGYIKDLGIKPHSGDWPEVDEKSNIYTIVKHLNEDLSEKFGGSKPNCTKDLPW